MGGLFFYFRSLIFSFFPFFFFAIPPLPFLGLLIYWKDQSEKGELLMARCIIKFCRVEQSPPVRIFFV